MSAIYTHNAHIYEGSHSTTRRLSVLIAVYRDDDHCSIFRFFFAFHFSIVSTVFNSFKHVDKSPNCVDVPPT